MPQIELIAFTGPLCDRSYRVFDDMIIGRGDTADLTVPDLQVSRRHAKILLTDEGVGVQDLSSHNGTWVNGTKADQLPLSPGDVLRIGSTEFRVVEVETEQPQFPILERIRLRSTPSLEELPEPEFLEALGLPASTKSIRTESHDVYARGRHLAIVYDLARMVGAVHSVEPLLQKALTRLLEVTLASRAIALLVDSETGELVPRAVQPDLANPKSIPYSRTIAEWVVAERTSIVSANVTGDHRFQSAASVVSHNLRSVLCAPIARGDAVIGVLHLDAVEDEFTRDDLQLISVIAPLLAVAIENARLHEERERAHRKLKSAHDRLLQTQAQLVKKERMATLGRFTSGLTHEIRNLIVPFALADLLKTEYSDDENIHESASLMLEAYRRIGSLVEELRLLSRGETGELNLQEHHLEHTMERVVAFARCDQQVRQHDIQIVAENIPAFHYDENRLKQVFLNLIRNAAEAIEGHGTITLSARVDPDEPTWARVSIQDDGCGIDTAALDKIFEPFFTTKEEAGTGLGLDICLGIVKAHGGNIRCESKKGTGTTFILRLPMNSTDATETLCIE